MVAMSQLRCRTCHAPLLSPALPTDECSAALQSMAAVHLAALSASWAGATEPCTTVLRQLAVVASLGHPASSSPELLALVRHQLQLLRASKQ